jgi:hypothetical protein
MSLVASERRFGPGGATAVLAIVLMFLAGVLYVAQRLFPSLDEAVTPPGAAAVLPQTLTTRKSERSRTTDNVGTTSAKINVGGDASTEQTAGEKRTQGESAKSQIEKITAEVAKPQTASGRVQGTSGGATRKPTRPGAPSIRLPNPEFRDNAPAPSPDARVRTSGTSSAAPRFYRSVDGTEFVKFSDGSTQVVESRVRKSASSRATPRFYRLADGTQIVQFPDGSTRLIRPAQGSKQLAYRRGLSFSDPRIF